MSPVPAAGVPGCLLLPGFLDPREADRLFTTLLDRVAWRCEPFRIDGRDIPAPRLVAWCGDPGINYRYAGIDHVCTGWLPELHGLRARLLDGCGFVSRLALLNRYRSGADGMGWHTDDEPGQGALVASVSLGARRRFRLRPTPDAASVALDLEHGSLLLMPAALSHALPKTRRAIGERINISLRNVTDAGPHAG